MPAVPSTRRGRRPSIAARFARAGVAATGLALGAALAALLWPARDAFASRSTAAAPRSDIASDAAASLAQPRFVPNRGQYDAVVAFALVGAPGSVWFTGDGWTVASMPLPLGSEAGGQSASLRMSFVGAASRVDAFGERRLGSRSNYFLGGDSRRWITGVDEYAAIRYPGVWPGVDVCVRAAGAGSSRGSFAYDLVLASADALSRVALQVTGARRLHVDAAGCLIADVPLADGSTVELRQHAPVAWFESADGTRRPVECRFARYSADTFGFSVDGSDDCSRLVIDPTVEWATYLGGASSDSILAMAHDSSGRVVVGGWAGSSDFPTTPGAHRTTGSRDAFVAALGSDGRRLLWSTYLGGLRSGEEVRALAVDPRDGAVVVGGFTGSDDFPVTVGAFQRTFAGGSVLGAIGDAFVTALAPDGSALRFSTYLGARGDDFVEAVHVDRAGVVTVAGHTDATDFPTTARALQRTFRSASVLVPDGFVTRFTPDGSSLVWSTFLGGAAQDLIFDMHVAEDGACTVVGLTASDDFAVTTGAFQRVVRGLWDGFVAGIAADGRNLRFATFLGGDGHDQCRAVAVDARGEILVAGRTSSEDIDFPMRDGALQIGALGEDDGYVARLSADGRRLRAVTLLGGEADDSCEAIAVDPVRGDVWVAGSTWSGRFPVAVDAPSPRAANASDAFVARLDAELSTLLGSVFLGGAEREVATACVPVGADEVLLGGRTWSSDFGTTAGTLQPASGGGEDGFLARVRIDGAGASALSLRELGASPDRISTFTPGERLTGPRLELRNALDRVVDVVGFDIVIGGRGDAARDLARLRLHHDVDRDGRLSAGDRLLDEVLGPADDTIVRIATPTLQLLPGEIVALLLTMDSSRACPEGAELSLSVLPHSVVARDVERDARRVPISGGGSVVRGRVWVCGAVGEFPDFDDDGDITCRDARVLVGRLGARIDRSLDPDSDGVVTQRDVDVVVDRILARPSVTALPEHVDLGGTVTIGGVALGTGIAVLVDGQELELLVATAGELVFLVDPSLGPGMRHLEVVGGGRLLATTEVEVR